MQVRLFMSGAETVLTDAANPEELFATANFETRWGLLTFIHLVMSGCSCEAALPCIYLCDPDADAAQWQYYEGPILRIDLQSAAVTPDVFTQSHSC